MVKNGEVATKRLSYEEFTKRFIEQFRDTDKSQGVNTVMSGYNDALKAYYGNSIDNVKADVIWGGETHTYHGAMAIPQLLAQEGKIEMRPIKGGKGVQIFLKGELSARRSNGNGSKLLDKMGLKATS